MFKPLTYLLAFFSKEASEVFRQPRLILSLILGPFLILLVFGLSFTGGLPHFRIALVVPPNAVTHDQLVELEKAIQTDFSVVSDDSNLAAAEAKLRNGQVEIVEILPPDFAQNVQQGRQSEVKFEYAEIDPTNESWVKYLGSSQVDALNRIILRQAIGRMQQQSHVLANVPPQTVVSPLIPQYTNLEGTSLSFVKFYAPSVFALLLQHIAVTLGALSLVRERLRGILEMFRIAPIPSASIIDGKYLGYIFFLAIITALLLGLLLFLGVPFLGNIWVFVAFTLLLIVASLGIGFFLSCISNSDTTAIQLSMLMLLLSIFFSGFFLPITNFVGFMQPLMRLIPLTEGIQGFQNILLKGQVPSLSNWLYLAGVALVMYIITQAVFRRQLRHLG
jgi:ABC-2 type transport system permease protein